jgi:diacylglycerol O-acyltransferase
MRRIDLTSAGFLLLEKRETPMHVGGVNLFTLPEGADEQDLPHRPAREAARLHGVPRPSGTTSSPEDRPVLGTGRAHRHGLPRPALGPARAGSLPRAVRPGLAPAHHAAGSHPPAVGTAHDRGPAGNRQFAIYNKIHHAAIDGVGACTSRRRCAPRIPGSNGYAPFSLEAYEAYKQQRFGSIVKAPPKPDKRDLRNVLEALKQQYDSSMHLATAMRRFGLAFVGRSGNLAVPWHNVPRTSINTRVSGARRFVAQTFEFERVKRDLQGHGRHGQRRDPGDLCRRPAPLPAEPRRTAPAFAQGHGARIAARRGRPRSTNAVGFITADLATNVYDPEKRLRTIQASMRAGKDLLKRAEPGGGRAVHAAHPAACPADLDSRPGIEVPRLQHRGLQRTRTAQAPVLEWRAPRRHLSRIHRLRRLCDEYHPGQLHDQAGLRHRCLPSLPAADPAHHRPPRGRAAGTRSRGRTRGRRGRRKAAARAS